MTEAHEEKGVLHFTLRGRPYSLKLVPKELDEYKWLDVELFLQHELVFEQRLSVRSDAYSDWYEHLNITAFRAGVWVWDFFRLKRDVELRAAEAERSARRKEAEEERSRFGFRRRRASSHDVNPP